MAYYFHWPLAEILDLEHPLRRAFVGQIDEITARMTAGTAARTEAGAAAGAAWPAAPGWAGA